MAPVHQEMQRWQATVERFMPHLSQPQAAGLALWSFGMVLVRSCGLTMVSTLLARLLRQQENTVRQRLREWYQEAAHKRGAPRREVQVDTCFAPLLGWILAWWEGHQLTLALDATYLGDRFVVLVISVLYRESAVPVAWVVRPAEQAGSWREVWRKLLRAIGPAVPASMTVVVLADRGLYAPWLFRWIQRLGWHPLLRVNGDLGFRPQGETGWRPLARLVRQPGSGYAGRGEISRRRARRVACTVLAWWASAEEEPWLLVSDLSPHDGDARPYGWRSWIERSFQLLKRDGWQWQRTRMQDPERVARFWLALAVATLRLLSLEAADQPPDRDDADVLAWLSRPAEAAAPRRYRALSLFKRAWIHLLTALLLGEPVAEPRFVPLPLPGWGPDVIDHPERDEVHPRAA